MTDRHQPTPPASQPAPEDFPELQEATIRLMRDSAAFRELTFQVQLASLQAGAVAAAMTAAAGRPSGPAAVDLTAIWRAAQGDPSCRDSEGHRRYMSPKRFANGWSHLIRARHDEPKGRRIFVDSGAALSYAQLVDTRILEATYDAIQRKNHREMLADPIGHAMAVCRGGPFGIMCNWPKIQLALGMTTEELAEAVVERAKEVAKQLDDREAESLMAGVRSAIEGMPRIEIINLEDGKTD